MAKIIRALIWLVWLSVSAVTVYILYNVIQTEPDSQVVWAWIVMSVLVFFSVSFLAYTAGTGRSVPSADDDEDDEDEDEEDDEE